MGVGWQCPPMTDIQRYWQQGSNVVEVSRAEIHGNKLNVDLQSY